MTDKDAEWLPPRAPEGSNAGEPDENWHAALIRGRASKAGPGEPKAILANAVTAFRNAPEWAGVLAFNEFSLSVVMQRAPVFGGSAGAAWTDHEDRLAADWLQHQGIFVSVEVAGQAVQAAARNHSFHPVRDYLTGLKWDGTKRADGWLSLYMGVETSDYVAAVGQRWLLSAVARIFEPGCKADCVLIVEGPQGIRKSTALRVLAQPWFADELAELGSKDASMQVAGVWVLEISELDAMTRAEVSKVKAFASRAVDRYRPPYGRHLVEAPRQCVFAGSVNHSTYLRDETGGRRFWPVTCTRAILVDELARDRDQLWAESVMAYRAGARWWIDTPELSAQAEDEQSARYEGSAWDDLIGAWLAQRLVESVSVAEILDGCIGKRVGEWNRADEMKVSAALSKLNWKRYRDRQVGMQWRYRSPVPIP